MTTLHERRDFVRTLCGEISDGLSFMETFESDQERYEDNLEKFDSISLDDALNDSGKFDELTWILDDLVSFMETCIEYDEETYDRWKIKSDLLDEAYKFKF